MTPYCFFTILALSELKLVHPQACPSGNLACVTSKLGHDDLFSMSILSLVQMHILCEFNVPNSIRMEAMAPTSLLSQQF